MTAPEQIIGGDAHDKEGTQQESSNQGVDESVDGGRVEHDRPEIDNFGAHDRRSIDDPRPAVAQHSSDLMTGRCLLPTVRNDDPDRRKHRAERNHDRREKVKAWRHTIPAEYQYGKKTRLEKESKDSFRCQSRSEYVADKAGIGGPVRTELKLHDNARCYSNRKSHGIQRSPESSRRFIDGFAFE